ncbi:sigma-E factor negative regulatory protein RseC [Gammaproteobacteria bacterium]
MEMIGEKDTIIEAFARVVSVDDDIAWLEPEPKTTCDSCTSLVCSAGNLTSRIVARRFILPNEENFMIGERVVVGVHESTLLKAALTVYAIPLVVMIGTGIAAQWSMGRDGITLVSSVAGLFLGFGIARLNADRLSAKGRMAPFFVRRADQSGTYQKKTCHSKNKLSEIEPCKNT